MVELNKIFDIFCNIANSKKNCFNKGLFYFLFGEKSAVRQLKMSLDTNCLVLSQYPGAEAKGLGGLIAQYPKNFEVLCFTNGESLDSAAKNHYIPSKYAFSSVMKMTRVKGHKVFDIKDGTLDENYQIFRKIDISEADYIFIPNVYDKNPDTIALLAHFKKLLKEKDYKNNLKIFMYESDFCLCSLDYFVDITSIIETKKKMLNEYYPKDQFPDFVERMTGLNSFRALNFKCSYAETFLGFSVNEFLNIPLI